MARFGEEIRSILEDVAKFLHLSLRHVTLPASASDHRLKLMTKIKGLQDTYPQLTWNEDYPVSDPPASEGPVLVAAGDIKQPDKEGFLARKAPSATFAKPLKYLKKDKKLWCVIQCGMFYGFEKQTSISQLFSFPLKGLEVKAWSTGKDHLFELADNDQKYTFSLTDVNEVNSWVAVLKKQVLVTADSRLSVSYSSEIDSTSNKESHPSVASSPPTSKSTDLPNQPPSTEHHTSETSPANAVIYETAADLTLSPEKPPPRQVLSKPISERPLPADPDDNIYHELATPSTEVTPNLKKKQSQTVEVKDAEQVVYEFAPSPRETAAAAADQAITKPSTEEPAKKTSDDKKPVDSRPKSVATQRPSPAGPAHQRPPGKRESRPDLLVESSPSTRSSNITEGTTDMCIALWDCTADADNELSFRKGNRLRIIGWQYEHLGWLVAELSDITTKNYKTGLIPKGYVRKC